MAQETFKRLDPRSIVIDPDFNPRENLDIAELKEQIRENGVQETLRVWEDEQGVHHLMNGHRRMKSVLELIAESVPIMTVPCMVTKERLTEADRLLQAMLANAGKPFEPYEEAKAFKRLLKFGWTQEQIAKSLGKSHSYVSQRLTWGEATPVLIDSYNKNEIGLVDGLQIIREGREEGKTQEQVLEQVKQQKAEQKKETAVAREKKKTPEILSVQEQYDKDKEALFVLVDQIQIDDILRMFIEYCEKELLEFLIPHFDEALIDFEKNIPSMPE